MVGSRSKREFLEAAGALNPSPERVRDEKFQREEGEFFDPQDKIQLKYEMLPRPSRRWGNRHRGGRALRLHPRVLLPKPETAASGRDRGIGRSQEGTSGPGEAPAQDPAVFARAQAPGPFAVRSPLGGAGPGAVRGQPTSENRRTSATSGRAEAKKTTSAKHPNESQRARPKRS